MYEFLRFIEKAERETPPGLASCKFPPPRAARPGNKSVAGSAPFGHSDQNGRFYWCFDTGPDATFIVAGDLHRVRNFRERAAFLIKPEESQRNDQ